MASRDLHPACQGAWDRYERSVVEVLLWRKMLEVVLTMAQP